MTQAPAKVQAPAPSPPAATPRIPVVQGPVSTTVAVPATRADAEALRNRVAELSGQLNAANSRRVELGKQLRNAFNGPDRTGLEDRMGVLDKRILQIETDVADVGRALSAAPAGVLTGTTAPGRNFNGPTPGQMTAISIVGTIFVLFPLVIAFARLLWRRAVHPAKPLPPSPELTGRLDRMEQGIEVIALEVERISEGQRFVTRLLSDNAARTPEPVRLPNTASR
jgi:hypothetical protein